MIPIYYENKNNILTDLLPRVKTEDNLLLSKAYLTWNSVLPQQKRNLELAKEHGIPSYTYTHGLFGYHDNCKGITDAHTGNGSQPILSDYYLAWGQAELDNIDFPKEKTKVIGCPMLWKHDYLYFNDKTKVAHKLGFYAGELITDPATKDVWKFVAKDDSIPQYDRKGQIVAYFPNHSLHLKELTTNVYNEIKDLPDIFIKATSNHASWKEQPWKELGDEKNRINKIIYTDIQQPTNIAVLHSLIRKCKIAIFDVPSSAQLLCWAAGVHTIVVNYDMGVKKDGQRIDLWTKADTVCEINQIKDIVNDIKSGKIDKSKEMAEMVEYYGGISYGNPTDNILNVLGGKNGQPA